MFGRNVLSGIVLALALTACGTDETAATDSTADATASDGATTSDTATGGDALPGFAPAQTLYDQLGVHEVAITMAPADWQDILATAATSSLPRTYHTAEATIDGVKYANAGARVFGQSSMWSNPKKPNIRMKFDEFDNALHGPDGTDSIRLKAGGTEPTYLRELISLNALRSAEAWRSRPKTSRAVSSTPSSSAVGMRWW